MANMRVLHEVGFGLVEWLGCLAALLVSVLMISNGMQWLAMYRVQAVSQAIRSAVQEARGLAYGLGETCVLSPLSHEKTWSNGLQLFKINAHSARQVVQVWQWHPARVKVWWRGMGHTNEVIFTAHAMHAVSSGHFLIESGDVKTKLVLNRLGRLNEEAVNE